MTGGFPPLLLLRHTPAAVPPPAGRSARTDADSPPPAARPRRRVTLGDGDGDDEFAATTLWLPPCDAPLRRRARLWASLAAARLLLSTGQ